MDLIQDLPHPPRHGSQSLGQAAMLITQLSDQLARQKERAQRDSGMSPVEPGRPTGQDMTVVPAPPAMTVDPAGAAMDHFQRATQAAAAAADLTGAPGSADADVDAAASKYDVVDTQTTIGDDALEARDAATTAGKAFTTICGSTGPAMPGANLSAAAAATPPTSAASRVR